MPFKMTLHSFPSQKKVLETPVPWRGLHGPVVVVTFFPNKKLPASLFPHISASATEKKFKNVPRLLGVVNRGNGASQICKKNRERKKVRPNIWEIRVSIKKDIFWHE